MENLAMDATSDTFLVPLQGELIACRSLVDAVAIKDAGAALDEGGWQRYRSNELEKLVDVLKRYQRTDAVETLTRLSARLRAAEILAAVGYDSPRRRAIWQR
jgi:hypothetical protein